MALRIPGFPRQLPAAPPAAAPAPACASTAPAAAAPLLFPLQLPPRPPRAHWSCLLKDLPHPQGGGRSAAKRKAAAYIARAAAQPIAAMRAQLLCVGPDAIVGLRKPPRGDGSGPAVCSEKAAGCVEAPTHSGAAGCVEAPTHSGAAGCVEAPAQPEAHVEAPASASGGGYGSTSSAASFDAESEQLSGISGGEQRAPPGACAGAMSALLGLEPLQQREGRLPMQGSEPASGASAESQRPQLPQPTPAPETASAHAVTADVAVAGLVVTRGPDWQWGDQDGGRGSLGTLEGPSNASGFWKVRWTNGGVDVYRVGFDGLHDLALV